MGGGGRSAETARAEWNYGKGDLYGRDYLKKRRSGSEVEMIKYQLRYDDFVISALIFLYINPTPPSVESAILMYSTKEGMKTMKVEPMTPKRNASTTQSQKNQRAPLVQNRLLDHRGIAKSTAGSSMVKFRRP